MSNQQLVDLMEHVWSSIGGLCSALSEAEWKTPTDCPGWSVQDQVAHLAGSESRILGIEDPAHTPTDTGHVKSDSGLSNELVVDWRRPWTGQAVLEEFRELTGRRLRDLRAMSDDDFAVETQTPLGLAPVSEFVSIRIMDAWVHEQDIRRALDRPGELDGPTAAHSLGRIIRAMPFVVARRAQAPDGATVIFDITGPAGRLLPVAVESGRGREANIVPADSTVRITTDAEAFGCLGCGRWDPDEALQSGRVEIQGEVALGQSIVRQMNIMP